jgi:hypothetical protein
LNCPIDHAPIFGVAKITGYQCTAERTVHSEVVAIIKGKYEHRPAKSLVPPPLALAGMALVDCAPVLHARTFRFIAQIGGQIEDPANKPTPAKAVGRQARFVMVCKVRRSS